MARSKLPKRAGEWVLACPHPAISLPIQTPGHCPACSPVPASLPRDPECLESWGSSLAFTPVSSSWTSPFPCPSCCVLGTPLHVPFQHQPVSFSEPQALQNGGLYLSPEDPLATTMDLEA